VTRSPDPRNIISYRGDDASLVQAQLAALKQQQSQLFADMARGQERFRRLARSVWRVQEDERRRFARDLHDGLGQNITAILHQLEPLAASTRMNSVDSQRIERAIDLCTRALHDTRMLAHMLRPKILDDLGLCAALNWLCRSVSEGSGFAVEVDCIEDLVAANDDLATLLFRVVQEALNNIAKHAGASQALVKLSVRDGQLHLLVADDGGGCDPGVAMAADGLGSGSGLGSMRERLALFGGHLALISSPGDGTQLRAVLPLRGNPEDG